MYAKRIMTAIAVFAAVVAAVPLTSAYAAAGPPPRGQEVGGPLPLLKLPGGLRVERAPGRPSPHGPMVPASYTNYGNVYIVNYYQDTFAITDQPSSYSGRLANHLYMWTNNGWSTQIFDLLYNNSAHTYVFVSQYNGSQGGVAYGCINVPGVSHNSGVQLIVYSCSGYPSNEQFYPVASCYNEAGASFCNLLQLSYDGALSLGIGNNFPGDGAWVITYGTDSGNWEERWIWY